MSIRTKLRIIMVGRLLVFMLGLILAFLIVQSFIEIRRLSELNKVISEQNRTLNSQTVSLGEQNKVLANQNKAYVRCVANIFAQHTRDNVPIQEVDLDTCTVLKEGQELPVESKQPEEQPPKE